MQYSPHEFIPPLYGFKGKSTQTKIESLPPLLDPKDTQWVQSTIGSFLYYTCALDSTGLPTLNQLGAEQAEPTQRTKQNIQHLMDYAYT